VLSGWPYWHARSGRRSHRGRVRGEEGRAGSTRVKSTGYAGAGLRAGARGARPRPLQQSGRSHPDDRRRIARPAAATGNAALRISLGVWHYTVTPLAR